MKTTHGLLSLDHVVPLCSGFDTVGPLAKTVEDAALMFTALGGDVVDIGASPTAGELKFGVIGRAAMDDCEPEVIIAYEAAKQRVARAGVTLVDINPEEFDRALALGPTLFPFEAWQQWGELIAANPGVMYEPVENRFRQGENLTKAEHDAAWQALETERSSFWSRTTEFDGFIFPTLAGLPPKIDDIINDPEVFARTNLLTLRNTRHVNLMGGCAATLPLPEKCIGFQLMGRPNEDVSVLQMAAILETIVNP
jgi:aspartyl-tRNA(Asn)/glutamyl-tRNA(Gln) amidotransferase subunit A